MINIMCVCMCYKYYIHRSFNVLEFTFGNTLQNKLQKLQP